MARNSGSRLARLLAGLSFADEILVGVDDASTDDTFEVARAHADVVYRFRHDDSPIPARLLPFRHTRCDWILALDDDEALEEGFPALLPDLVSSAPVTHVIFPRKWVVGTSPARYARAAPWFPDWQVRLFRNDLQLIWRSPRIHSGYKLVGQGVFCADTAILHDEPHLLDAERRAAKLERYLRLGTPPATAELFGPVPESVLVPLETRRLVGEVAPRRGQVGPTYELAPLPTLPPWSAELSGQPPRRGRPGAPVVGEIVARNTGAIAWSCPGQGWTPVNLAYHVLGPTGETLLFDGQRTPLSRVVRPGESIRLLPWATVPDVPGDLVIVWDLVGEHEAWFEWCGSRPLQQVLPAAR
jgi:hypothetical protein